MIRRSALTLLIIAVTAIGYVAVLNAVAHTPHALAIPALAFGMWAVFHAGATTLGKVK